MRKSENLLSYKPEPQNGDKDHSESHTGLKTEP